MVSYRTIKISVVALSFVAPVAVAEEVAQAVHVEAEIAGSCYSADVGFRSFWMLSGPLLARVDLSDNSIRRVPVTGLQSWHSSVTMGEGAVWLLDGRTTIYKIDPQNEQVVQELPIELGDSAGLGVGEGAVWVIPDGKKLVRYAATNLTEEATVPLPSYSSHVLVAFGSVWVSGTGNDDLYRIDPSTNQIVRTIELRARPGALAADEGSLWVFNQGDGTLQRIHGKSGEELASIETDAIGKATITIGGGFVWVGTQSGMIIQVDPRTNAVRGKLDVKGRTAIFAIRYAGNSLWICGDTALRIAPPK